MRKSGPPSRALCAYATSHANSCAANSRPLATPSLTPACVKVERHNKPEVEYNVHPELMLPPARPRHAAPPLLSPLAGEGLAHGAGVRARGVVHQLLPHLHPREAG